MRINLKLKANNFCPDYVEINPSTFYLNNVVLPKYIDPDGAFNPHNVRCWVIGHEHGPVCAIWAPSEQEAFDEAADAGGLDCFLTEKQDYDDESLTPLGNASELFDLSYAWIGVVEWDAQRDIKTIVSIVRAVENQKGTLED